jgi:hypothetical protein
MSQFSSAGVVRSVYFFTFLNVQLAYLAFTILDIGTCNDDKMHIALPQTMHRLPQYNTTIIMRQVIPCTRRILLMRPITVHLYWSCYSETDIWAIWQDRGFAMDNLDGTCSDRCRYWCPHLSRSIILLVSRLLPYLSLAMCEAQSFV